MKYLAPCVAGHHDDFGCSRPKESQRVFHYLAFASADDKIKFLLTFSIIFLYNEEKVIRPEMIPVIPPFVIWGGRRPMY